MGSCSIIIHSKKFLIISFSCYDFSACFFIEYSFPSQLKSLCSSQGNKAFRPLLHSFLFFQYKDLGPNAKIMLHESSLECFTQLVPPTAMLLLCINLLCTFKLIKCCISSEETADCSSPGTESELWHHFQSTLYI